MKVRGISRYSPPLPEGFLATGGRCGIAAKPGKKDLAVFASLQPCVAVGMFTTNRCKAAPVLVSEQHLRGGRAQAIVINSGCANAGTSVRGLADARAMCAWTARALGIATRHVLVASTGVIGEYLPMRRVRRGIEALARRVAHPGREERSGRSAAETILTTDTVRKVASEELEIRGRRVRVWGCAKGAGMIHPQLATMLVVLLTDGAITRSLATQALRVAVAPSFHCLSVDGDTSTNDSVFFLANGDLSGPRLGPGRPGWGRFQIALNSVCRQLAQCIAADGEGATKAVTLTIRGARSDGEARRLAQTVAGSFLVKSAWYGEDPNWGRIWAALGRAGVPLDPSRVDVAIGGLWLAKRGVSTGVPPAKAHRAMRGRSLPITIDVHQGVGRATYFTCDLSPEYVRLNADYRT
ncbi:MAG: bifunctional glutamate N-acetyltransferase/amino-acid acetyltransferase ArgJ [Elusimicrobia bacterium]|nr:bifunctional glutamate N-acetyltransferase/amino-acid acetyltransferase ArgJ [Elusimicrobiota bacterium]